MDEYFFVSKRYKFEAIYINLSENPLNVEKKFPYFVEKEQHETPGS